MYHDFPELISGYLESLRGRTGFDRTVRVASQWIVSLLAVPSREQLMDRHLAKGHGHFQPGATQANKELALVRSACRWGMYQGRWHGGDPTMGIKKWKTPKRKRIGKFEEIRTLLRYFACADTPTEIRDRALFGLQLFTGCRTGESRTALIESITVYDGQMGCWRKSTTKTGESQEIPLPWQVMRWIDAWKAIMPPATRSYLFPGQWPGRPLTDDGVRLRWSILRNELDIQGLWTYDLRRTLASYLSNDLHYDDKTIQAILNHYDGRAIGHYVHKTFDSLTGVIQQYADWLWALNQEVTVGRRDPVPPPRLVRVDPRLPVSAPIVMAPQIATAVERMEWPG